VDEAADWSLGQAIEEFFVARRSKKDSPHTLRAYRNDLEGIAGRLTEKPDALPLAALDIRALRRGFAHFADGHSPASVGRAWSTWNQFFTFLVADGGVPGNPMAAIGKPRAPRRTPKPLQGEDTPELLLEAVAAGSRKARFPWPERDLAFLATGLLTGLRLSELLALDMASVDGRPGERRIKVIGKGRKERFVPIEAALEEVLARYLGTRRTRFPGEKLGPSSPLFVDRKGARLRPGGAQYLVAQCYRHAGVGARVPRGALVHSLRHTFGTRLAEDGASASEIQHLLGHESLNTSQGYIDATAAEQRMAARANRTYRTLERLLTDRVSRPDC
jgi:site-specific recombinase XerD